MLSMPTILASLLALSSVAVAIPARRDDDPSSDSNSTSDAYGISGYKTIDISWDLPTDLNNASSPIVTVTGTVQQAVAAMEAAYPGWNATFQSKLPPPTADDEGDDDDDTADSKFLSLPERESFTCDLPYIAASTRRIGDGIKYLRGLSGTAKNGPGWGNCGRVSCSWSSAIYWCNDNAQEKEVGWNDIADGAEFLMHSDCVRRKKTVLGQVFFKDKWNVIVRHDENNC
ncbi:hypothetical protein QBC41DRAFT_304326 [Cercophora samala]|uniref:Uncharacterized protein n=1 Tax=Cercophora samala TaxID=330535 RepID=A0AA39ZAU7_9PEZI|nr:hypothetical protein QBC41DRAFT_304326 [Cercophora samala]